MVEFERDLIRERTNAGLAAARARGRTGGRPPPLTADKLSTARKLYAQQDMTVAQIGEVLGSVGPRSIGRYTVTRKLHHPRVVVQPRRCSHGRGHTSTGIGWCRRTDPELQRLIEGLALSKPRRSIAAIARTAQIKAAQQGWPAVSYTTVRSIIQALDPGMVMLAHQVSAAYRDHFELV